MRYITAAAALALFALAVVLLAVSLTPATVIAAMVMLGAAGAFASFALFTEADDTTPADDTAGDLLIPNDTTTADDFDGTAHLLNMMEATAATIDPTDPNLFVYRPALNGNTRWTATLHDTHNNIITTVSGDTQTPGVVDMTNYYRDTGTADHFTNVNALHAAWELEADLPNIIPV